jgi:uncharacterized damage-inducible protein DinB
MTLTDILLAEAEATYVITERLMRRVSDDELTWKPGTGSNWMTLGQLLMHCACFSCGRPVHGFVSGDWGTVFDDSEEPSHLPPAEALPAVTTVRQALELLAADREVAVSAIRAAGEAELLGRTVAAPWGGPPQPLCQQVLRMIAHLAQHKGQLFYYLKLMGKDVGTADLWAA